MSAESVTMPLVGRCKECDFALFVGNPAEATEVADFSGVKAGTQAYRVGNEGFFARCPNRHKFFVLKRIKGTFSKDHECDARCLNAKGNDCTCSCGGINHGRGHAVTAVAEATTRRVDVSPVVSDKQKIFIHDLLAEREIPAKGDVTGDERRRIAIDKLNADEFSRHQATETITWLKTLPKIREAA